MDRLFSFRADGRAASVMRGDKKRPRESDFRGPYVSYNIFAPRKYREDCARPVPKADSAVCCMDQKDENTFLRVHDKTNSPDKRRFPYKKEYVMICHAVLFISRK